MSRIFPTWDEMGTGRRVVEAGVMPVLGGVLTGFAATQAAVPYVVNVLIAAAVAVLIGSQHRDVDEAAWRGAWSGSLYAIAILVVAGLAGGKAPSIPWWVFPDSSILLFLMIALPSVPLHRLGSRLRHGRTVEPPARRPASRPRTGRPGQPRQARDA